MATPLSSRGLINAREASPKEDGGGGGGRTPGERAFKEDKGSFKKC